MIKPNAAIWRPIPKFRGYTHVLEAIENWSRYVGMVHHVAWFWGGGCLFRAKQNMIRLEAG